MNRSERVFIVLVFIGIILDLLHLPMASLLIVIGASLLVFLYAYLAFAFFNEISLRQVFKKEAYADIGQAQILIAIVAGLALAGAASGTLFRFQLWPGAEFMLLVGIVGLFIVGLVLVIRKIGDAPFRLKLLTRVVLFGIIALGFYFLPSRTLLGWHFPEYPALIDAEVALEADPDNSELQAAANAEWDMMHAQEKEKMMDATSE